MSRFSPKFFAALIVPLFMRQLLLMLLFTTAQLQAFDLRSDIAHAYRHQNWKRVETLSGTFFNPPIAGDRYFSNQNGIGKLHFMRGVALWHQGNWQKASYCFESAYRYRGELFSQPYALRSLLGWSDCAHRLGDYAMSIRIARKFQEEAPAREWQRKSPFANGPEILGYYPYFGELLPRTH